MPSFRLVDALSLLLVLAAAAGARAWYVNECCDGGREAPPLVAQGPAAGELANLTHNLAEHRWFGGLAPLADREEKTAHVAPGYPWLIAYAEMWSDEPGLLVRWVQVGLGTLTAGLYFLFARRAFHSLAVALLAGLLCALHPFWVVNAAEVADGTLASFLLAAVLVTGTRASQEGDAFPSLLFGLALAGLVLVRAALLPFAGVALLWFLFRSRSLRRGWLCGLLAFLGFANGIAPWTVRNFQAFNDAVPVADSMWLHLWVGNNKAANGGPQTEATLRGALRPDRLQALLAEESQPKRYGMLARDVWDEASSDWAETLRRRLEAGLGFFFGQAWFADRSPGDAPPGAGRIADLDYPLLVQLALVAMLFLGLLGWRWTYGWRRHSALAAVAAVWIPLPYVLSHAEWLWGPRMPLDGVLLCYAAFAVVCVIPGLRSGLAEGRA